MTSIDTTPAGRIAEIIKPITQLMNPATPSKAAEDICSEFVVIHRDELSVVTRGFDGRIQTGNRTFSPFLEASTARKDGLLLLSIAHHLETAQSAEAAAEKLAKRRDAVARELVEDGAYAYRFAGPDMQRAIDRIIELEAGPLDGLGDGRSSDKKAAK